MIVIAILATIGVPKYFQAVKNARNIHAASDIKQIQIQIEEYHEYDLYSFGADGKAGDNLAHEDSLDDVIRADDGSYIGLAETYSKING